MQTEQEYMNTLKNRLSAHIPEPELEDILSDYTEHFRIGKTSGRSEQDLCTSLGAPEDVAREIRATHLVKKAEETRSCGNIWRAALATLGMGFFNLVFVLIPFIVLVLMLVVLFGMGVLCTVIGPVFFVCSLLYLAGISMPVQLLSPGAMVFFSIGITAFGMLLMIGVYYLARFFYSLGIRYLKWNIAIIKGTEAEP